MSKSRKHYALLAIGLLAAATVALPAAANPDSKLYTSYFFDSTYTNVYWVVCGATQYTGGCFGSGSIGPFGEAGNLIEGLPVVNTRTGTVTRDIYVVDEAVNGGTAVQLDVYKKTDVVTSSDDTVTVTFVKSVTLPLTGGTNAKTYMAADYGFLFIGTDQSPFAVRVQKSNLAVTQIGGFSPPVNVSSITSDQYGYVTVTFGGITGGNNGIYQYNPQGIFVGDGGGAEFMLSTSNGLTTANLTH